jgi:hypothetical protein
MLLDVLALKEIDEQYLVKDKIDFAFNGKIDGQPFSHNFSEKIVDLILETVTDVPESFAKYVDDILVELLVYLFPKKIEEHLIPYYACSIFEFVAVLLKLEEDYIDEIVDKFEVEDEDLLDTCFDTLADALQQYK